MNRPIVVASTLTGVYLLLGVLLLGSKLPELFTNQPLNSVGDFLAGFFAPLAFLWLVVSLLLQRKELELMREEQALAREQRNDMVSAAHMEMYSKSPNIKINSIRLIRTTLHDKRVDAHPLYLEIKASNDGGALCTELAISIEPTEDSKLFIGNNISGETLQSGENKLYSYALQHDLTFEEMRKDETFIISLLYSDMFGTTHKKSYWSWTAQTSYYEIKPTTLHLERSDDDEGE